MALRRVTIKLNDTKPLVSRKLIVPDDMRLSVFHLLIQAVMPWYNCHLYEFQAGNDRWQEDLDEMWIDYLDKPNLIADEWSIADLIKTTGKSEFSYLYDFGDSWEHTITVGSRVGRDRDEYYPLLTQAKGVCPPEDCGGIWGYYNMLKILNDPKHEEHEITRIWVGDNFDPKADVSWTLKLEAIKFAQLYEKLTLLKKLVE